MLKPKRMAKIRIICPKTHLREVVDELHRLKAIDIIEHVKDDNIDIGIPFEESAKLSEATILARTIISQLGIKAKDTKMQEYSSEKLKESAASIKRLHNDLTKLFSVEKETAARLKVLYENRDKIEAIKSLGISLELQARPKSLSYYIGYIDDAESLKADMASDIGENYEVRTSKAKGKAAACIFVDRKKEMAALKVLQTHGFQEMHLGEELVGKDAVYAQDIEKEIIEIGEKEKEAKEQIASVRDRWADRLPEAERALTTVIKKAEAPLRFGETKNIAIVSGWIAEKDKDKLKMRLSDITKDRVVFEELEIKEDDVVPIKLDNPKIISPYEFLIKLYSLPSYNEIDPILFMYFTFPLFFGFMLGDIGYGLVLLISVLIIKKMKPSWSQFMIIMAYAGLSSILFGILYGEVFGLEEVGHYHLWHIIERAHAINEMLAVSVIIGALHVNFGLLLGFINEMRHGLKRAVLEKGSWFILEISVIMLALSYMGILNIMPLVGWVVFAISVVMIYFGEGFKGIIELPSIFTHILSYARLMAVGLASVGLAVVINEETAPLFQKGIVGIIGGVLIIIFGHALNLGLGIIGPFLHSLRLHYVEHFTKYYSGGGKEFKAFGAEDD